VSGPAAEEEEPLPPLPSAGEVVILDLEWTAWEGSLARGWSEPWEFREVIAIGAVRAEAERFDVRGELELFVRPVKNPVLSEYIVRLTGITDALLADRGLSYADALGRFVGFAGDSAILANGGDGAVLRENCDWNGIPDPFDPKRIRSIRRVLARATGLDSPELVSAELPSRLGIGSLPERHGALSDAIAVRSALHELRRRGRL
jgi:inhibitor of KinA sporulation pathway (predicted exonuclease)